MTRALIAAGPFQSRVARIEIAPEHVRNAIGGFKDANDQALFGFIQGVEQHLFPFPVIGIGQFQKGRLVERAFVEGPRVVRLAEGDEAAQELGQIDRIDEGMGDGQRGFVRIDVERGEIQFEMRFDPGKIKFGDGPDLDAQARPEGQLDPGREDVFLKGEGLSGNLDPGFLFVPVDLDRHRKPDFPGLFKHGVLGTGDGGFDAAVLDLDREDDAAFALLDLEGIG